MMDVNSRTLWGAEEWLRWRSSCSLLLLLLQAPSLPRFITQDTPVIPLEKAQKGLQSSLGAIRGSPEVSDTLPSCLQQQISLLLQLLQVWECLGSFLCWLAAGRKVRTREWAEGCWEKSCWEKSSLESKKKVSEDWDAWGKDSLVFPSLFSHLTFWLRNSVSPICSSIKKRCWI